MGNYRFRFSDMMPNAWFYKLKDMNKPPPHRVHGITSRPTTKKHTDTPNPALPSNQPFTPNRESYYFPSRAEPCYKLPYSPSHSKASDTHFPVDPPRKSKRQSRRNPHKPSAKLVTTSVSQDCSCRVWRSESYPVKTLACRIDDEEDDDDEFRKPTKIIHSSAATDIIFDVGIKSHDFDAVLDLQLPPPILTKPPSKKQSNANKTTVARRSPSGLHRLRMRANSPKIANKKLQDYTTARRSFGRKLGLPQSFAVVKTSSDPYTDFRDSMVEMIVENNIRQSKDLEELLACYLTLNSNEYHDVIVKVFEQIWFDLTEIIRL